MKQFITNLIYELKLIWPFDTAKRLLMTRASEKFDVVIRVPAYSRITLPFMRHNPGL